jgi:ABC-type phosphate transport system permease subunit
MESATKNAICAIVIFSVFQLTLFFYSFSHPSANGLVAGSFMLTMIFYPAVFRYHAQKMKALKNRSAELPRDSN